MNASARSLTRAFPACILTRSKQTDEYSGQNWDDPKGGPDPQPSCADPEGGGLRLGPH